MVHFTLYTLCSILYTPRSTLDTPPSALYTAHFALHSLHLTLHTSHCTLYAPHSTLYSPHLRFTVHTLHFKLYTFTLYTWHFALDLHNFALFTLCAAWNLGLAWFSCCARTLTFCPQLPFFHCILHFFPRFQRSTPMPKVDLWIFPNYLPVCLLCWNSSSSSCNSTRKYVLILVLSNKHCLNT